MKIYFKCTFKFGIGYQIGEYRTETHELTHISERDESIKQSMSRKIADTLQTQIGRSMLLAVDETGQLFVGIFGLIFGEYVKYVNAVFVGESPRETLQVFLYFCSNYRRANELLLASISRDESPYSKTGFTVDASRIQTLLEGSERIRCEVEEFPSSPSTHLVFATRDTFSDHRIDLLYIFKEPPILRLEHIRDDMEQIESTESISEIFVSKTKKLSGHMLLLVAALLVIIIALTILYLCERAHTVELPVQQEPISK